MKCALCPYMHTRHGIDIYIYLYHVCFLRQAWIHHKHLPMQKKFWLEELSWINKIICWPENKFKTSLNF